MRRARQTNKQTAQRAGAFTLIELLIVVAIIAILAAIAVPNFLEAQTRSKVSRTATDMRSVMVALEAYRVDSDNYPFPTFTYSTDGHSDSTFEIDNPQQGPTGVLSMTGNVGLTTPVAYLTTLPRDVFSPDRTHWFGYCTIQRGRNEGIWILTSLGPNTIQPIQRTLAPLDCPGWMGWQGGDIQEALALADAQHRRTLMDRTYDPTNGTVSAGDIWRSNVDLVNLR